MVSATLLITWSSTGRGAPATAAPDYKRFVLGISPQGLNRTLDADVPHTVAHSPNTANLPIAVDLRSSLGRPLIDRILEALGPVAPVKVRVLPAAFVVDVRVPHHADPSTMIATLTADLPVAWLQEDVFFEVVLRATPDDPRYPEQWTLHQTLDSSIANDVAINIEGAWDTHTGDGVRVAVIDDGFDLNHPDLSDRFDANGCDLSLDDASCAADADASWEGHDWHGTQTAGVIAATGFNGAGVTGVCPACTLLPIRLIGSGGPTTLYTSGSAAAEAINWAVDQGAAVINNSWGPPDGSPFDTNHLMTLWPKRTTDRSAGELPRVLQDALTRAVTQGRNGLGSVVTWSAGNGNELVTYDRFASDPRVLAIGSVASNGTRAFYSDFGPTLFAVAPSSGGTGQPKVITTDVTGASGTDPGDYTETYGGTSASAAIAAGVAALVINAYPQLTAAQVREAIALGAHPIDESLGGYSPSGHSSRYGYGRLDVEGALLAAAMYSDSCTFDFELCANGRDDNCDGEIDDVRQCTTCIPNADLEICDDTDNNCDGRNNENCACFTTDRPACAPCVNSSQCADQSLCRGSAAFPGLWCFQSCLAGEACALGYQCNGEVCELEPTEAFPSCEFLGACDRLELCNGEDDDKDGSVDNVSEQGLEAAAARRACRSHGVCVARGASCIDGKWLCATLDAYEPNETRLDGLDNDCDGAVDEDLTPPTTAAGGCGCGPSGMQGLWAASYAVLLLRRRRT